MKNLIEKFVIKYIREHMGHRDAFFRNDVFCAINDGFQEKFYEDNLPTRLSFTVTQVLQNDRQFMSCVGSNSIPKTMEAAIASAVPEVLGLLDQ